MKDNIPKILERIKGHTLSISKTKLFKMVLEIDNLYCIGEYVIVEVILKEYMLIAEHDNKQILIDGAVEYCTDSIVNIHNAAIRSEIRNVVKHYGIEDFSYKLKNVIF
jgi:hypothetical protein